MTFDAGSILSKFMLDHKSWDSGVVKITKDQVTIKKGLGSTGKSAQGLAGTFGASAKKIVGALGLGAGIAGAVMLLKNQVKDIIAQGLAFEKEWANVTTMLTLSSAETAKMKNELIGMSPVLGDTTELAKGMYQVLSASIEPAKAIEFLAEASKSAKAGVTDITTSVDALTTVINAYGMEADSVTDISDIMFATVKRGKLTYSELAKALGTVAPVAGTVGIRFEEISAGIATLTRQGIDARTATMQLRQVLMAIMKPGKQAMQTAKELGIEWSVASLKAKGLSGFLFDVKEKTKGNMEALAKLVPNVRALTGVMALAGKASEGFKTDLELMKEASGATEEAFRKQMQDAGFWIDTFKNAIGKFKISFFNGFIDPIKDSIGSSRELEVKLELMAYRMKKLGEEAGEALAKTSKFFKAISEGAKKPGGALEALADDMTGISEVAKDMEEQGYLTAVSLQKSFKMLKIPLEDIKKEMEKGKESFDKWTKAMKEQDEALVQAQFKFRSMHDVMVAYHFDIMKTKAEIIANAESHDEARVKIEEFEKSLEGFNEDLDAEADKLMEQKAILKGLGITLKEDLIDELEKAETALKNFKKQMTTKEVKKLEEQIEALKLELGLTTVNIENYDEKVSEMKALLMDFKREEFYKSFEDLAPTEDDTQALARWTVKMEDAGDPAESMNNVLKEMGIFIPNVTHEFKENKEELSLLTTQMDSFEKEAKAVLPFIQILADEIGGNFGDALSMLSIGLEQAITDFSELRKEGKSTGEAITGMLSSISPQVADQFAGSIGQMVSGAKKSFASLGAGLGGALGSIIPGVGTALGSAVGGFLGGLFKRKSKEEKIQEELKNRIEGQVKLWKKYGTITDETAQKIAKASMSMENYAAQSKYMGEIISDLGVNTENINHLWNRSGSILSDMKDGTLTTDEGLKALNESFSLLVTGAHRLGEEGSEAMIRFITRVRQSGEEVVAVTDYINTQLGVVKSGTLDASQGLLAMAQSAQVSFGNLYAEEGKAKEELDELTAKQKELNDALEDVGYTPQYYNDLQSAVAKTEKGIEKLNKELEIKKALLADTEEGTQGYVILTDQISKLESKLGNASSNQRNLNLEIEALGEGKSQYEALILDLADINGKIVETTSAFDEAGIKVSEVSAESIASMRSLESQTLAVFNAMIANGASYEDALNSVGGTLDIISQSQSDMGMEANIAIQKLLEMREVTVEHEALFTAIQGNQAVLQALGNTANLTQGSLTDAGRLAKIYYDQLIDAGVDSNIAMQQLKPTLESLAKYSDSYNLTIDEGTQSLIDMGLQMGVLSEEAQTPGDKMVEGIDRMTEGMGKMTAGVTESFERMGSRLEETFDRVALRIEKALGGGLTDALEQGEAQAKKTASMISTQFGQVTDSLVQVKKVSGSVFDEMAQDALFATMQVGYLDKSLAGHSVTSALEAVEYQTKKTFGTMQSEIKKSDKGVSGLTRTLGSAIANAEGLIIKTKGRALGASALRDLGQIEDIVRRNPGIDPALIYREISDVMRSEGISFDPSLYGRGGKGEVSIPENKSVVVNVGMQAVDTVTTEKWVRKQLLPIIDEHLRQNYGGFTDKIEGNLSRYRDG